MRHSLLFAILMALLPTLIFSQTTIPVTAGTNSISTALAGASSGDILELGSGTFIEQNTVVVDKSITIKAAAGLEDNMPVWKVEWVGADSTQNIIQLNTSLTLDGIKLDGLTVAGDTIQSALRADTNATPHLKLIVQNCEFINYKDMAIFIENALAWKVLIQTTTFAHIPAASHGVGTVTWFSNDTTGITSFTMANCTIYDTYGRSIYVRTDKTLEFLVDHVTIAVDTTGNVGEKTIEYRGEKAIVRNSIITCYPDSANSHGIRLGSALSIVEYIYAGPFLASRSFWKDKGDFVHPEENILWHNETILTFTDPDNGDFSYPDWQDAYTYGKDAEGNDIPLGDLRPFGMEEIIVGVEADDKETLVTEYKLSQNYPNPFNPSTVINYSIPESGLVTLKVFNILGQEIVELVNDVKAAGNYEVSFDASSLTTGMFIYKIQSGNYTATKKMLLIK